MRLRKKQRLYVVVGSLALLGGAAALVLTALDQNVAFFVTPTQVAERELPEARNFRIGGLVVAGSVAHDADGTVHFRLTDTKSEVPVQYAGVLPDLFREGQGIVAQGQLDEAGVFLAREVLAKHDESYMPKEVVDSLKASGVWQHEAGTPTQ
ncbi:MAG TPA: cytochrome c maturation protein CcmE [Geminicoccus sp.]|jgi:cytochrome c-type biogenesis protein CcmE|uniref:cytochrome c maturation protein CcmE n=1 Tax=Geminicoccus sp. TaxID=2024832 RepID=UPI002E31933E|nr:cytochrome c maturation protein CcmE [Geminicoccus sp.]HEX2526504.1 cytochrome c maturation protein CcmE [Geminicoccus sp.]